jgi:hypothetical protein
MCKTVVVDTRHVLTLPFISLLIATRLVSYRSNRADVHKRGPTNKRRPTNKRGSADKRNSADKRKSFDKRAKFNKRAASGNGINKQTTFDKKPTKNFTGGKQSQ